MASVDGRNFTLQALIALTMCERMKKGQNCINSYLSCTPSPDQSRGVLMRTAKIMMPGPIAIAFDRQAVSQDEGGLLERSSCDQQ
jgi:hypothetical protein